MAKKRDSLRHGEVKKETWQAVTAIAFFVLAILSILAAIHKAGIIGEHVYSLLQKLAGIGYFLFPVLLVMLGVAFLKGIENKFQTWKMIGSFIFFAAGLGLIDLLIVGEGGALGRLISRPLISLLDVWAAAAILFALLAASIMITFDIHFTVDHLLFWRRWQNAERNEEEEEEDTEASDKKLDKTVKEIEKKYKEEADDEAQKEVIPKIAPKEDEMEGAFGSFISTRSDKPFVPPPLSLLEKDKGKPETGDIKANANIIKRTLANFGISVEMDEISIGPSVTRYALKPAEGVKLSKIVALNNDLALALAAHPIRIEAPIPGKVPRGY
jgi:S-DNA-T family DNA segregation ATPase FtsK/SpoIIIE